MVIRNIMVGGAAFAATLLSTLAIAAAPSGPAAALRALAGRYAQPFTGYNHAAGAAYRDTDIVAIAPVGRESARIGLSINFDNGHSCGISGMARMEGDRLVHRERNDDGSYCILSLWRDGDRLRWSDGDHSCIQDCGMRGTLSSGQMPYAARRPVTAPHPRRR